MSKGVKIVIIVVLLVLAVIIGKMRYDSMPKFESAPAGQGGGPGGGMMMPGGPPMAPKK